MARALAHVEKIEWIREIEGADNIELIGVLGWVCIVKKNEFQVGDKCVYIEIDSKCNPNDERFSFLEKKKFKVKTMKLGKFKVISQGLSLPIMMFPEISGAEIGADVTEKLKITYAVTEDNNRKAKSDSEMKYKAMASRYPKIFKNFFVRRIYKTWIGKRLLFFIFGKKKDIPKNFPEWIVKTDEERIENLPFLLKEDCVWVQTEKLDGTSCTYAVDFMQKEKEPDFKKEPDFIVCSRNMRVMEDTQTYHSTNIYWEMATKYGLQEKMTDYARKNQMARFVLQGEGVGSVQGNKYKLEENDLFIFNIIKDGNRLGTIEMALLCKELGLKSVPIVNAEYRTPETMEEFKLEADGNSIINPNVKREGFVYRSLDGKQSFKNVSREFLLKHGE